MKILESTTIIGILREMDCPELIDKILQLNHELIIPSHVYNEIQDEVTKSVCDRLIVEGKIRISNINTTDEVVDFQKSYPYLGKGEADSMLHYHKLSNGDERVYCIFDDGRARKTAQERSIEFTGLIGLLKIMKKKDIITSREYEDNIRALSRSNFRVPRDLVK